jgi:hypothetical protein
VKFLGTTSDDDYVTNGAVVGGHVANLTTREFLRLLSWLAENADFDDTIEAYFRFGSTYRGEWGDDPTGEYGYIFVSPDTISPVTHYCDERCADDCDQDGQAVMPINAVPATGWFVDWDRYLRWSDRRYQERWVLYLSGSIPARPESRERMRMAGIGVMAQPHSYSPDSVRGWAWAADNGCFNEQWDPDHWLDWLHKMRDVPGCLFAVVPDKVADAEVTRQMFSDWAALVTDLGYRPAYVAQNGATCASIPWDDIACVFIGGDTDWKLGHQAEAITRHAKQLGKWVHMGRVNSLRRMRIAFYHYSAPSYQCQKRANTGEFGRKRLRLSQPCRTYVPMQPNNDEPTATTEPPDVARSLALHKRWLHGKEGGEPANLRSANLRSANLSSANLRSANLRSANLRSANLSSADLRSANLRSADLRSANLRYANLSSADLSSADLRSANLRSANLRYAANLRATPTSATPTSATPTLSRRGCPMGSAGGKAAHTAPGVECCVSGASTPTSTPRPGASTAAPTRCWPAIQYRRDDWAGELGADAAQTELDRFAVLMSVALDQLG